LAEEDRASQRVTHAIADGSEPLRRTGRNRDQLSPWLKGLLILGLLWALLVIVPDFYRLYGQLGSFGFSADNSGVIYEISGQPGLENNDHIPLQPGACWNPLSPSCRDFLAVFGGMGGLSYVRDGTTITLPIMHIDGRVENVTMSAQPAPLAPTARFWLALDETFGVIVIWLAFKLVWDRPSRMTLGFFLFAMWFNPGQYFTFYAWLQGHPIWLLIEEALQAIAQGAGYAGFVIFALRFPHDRTEPNLRGVERIAVALGGISAFLQLASFANAFGVPTELVTRCAILGGYAVALCAFFIVLYRMKHQSPIDYQRMRWVLWGCAIGLPAFIFADSNEATSLWARNVWNRGFWGGWRPGESVLEFGYLLCGILAVFIWTAVRHPRILNVTPELRALTVSGVFFVLGYALEDSVRGPMTTIFNSFGIPELVQFFASIVPLGLLGLVVHRVTRTAGHFFNLSFEQASTRLEELGKEAKRFATIEEIDWTLLNGPYEALQLASAAVFREAKGVFRLVSASKSWDNLNLSQLDSAMLKRLTDNLARGDTVALRVPIQNDDTISTEITAPALAVPVVFADELYAVAMYGPHATGSDFDRLEAKKLENFAQQIALGYERVSKNLMQNELQQLRQQIAKQHDARL
jgi:hypothetical protein